MSASTRAAWFDLCLGGGCWLRAPEVFHKHGRFIPVRKARRISDETAAVLTLFLSAPQEARYGREILVEAGLKSGSLYPILHRLEDRELLESSWEELQSAVEAKRRPRRLYRLRSSSAKRAQELLDEWQRAQRQAGRSSLGRERPA